MFSKNESPQDRGSMETVIGSSVKVDGNFKGSGDVSVEGNVVGSLSTSKNLRIGETAHVKADIKAENIYIAGEVRGNVTCKGKLELTSTGKIMGNVETISLMVQNGAILNGKVQMIEVENKEEVEIEQIVEDKNNDKKGKSNRK